MTPHDLNAVLLALAGAGVLARGRGGDCSTFAIYLGVCVAMNRLPIWWPEYFFTRPFWLTKEWVYGVLKLAIAVELAWRSFRPFRRARAAAVPAIAVAGGATAALLLGLRFEWATETGWVETLSVLLPRIQVAVIWTLVLLLAAVSWWRIPVDAFTRAIVLGFLLYGGAYAAALEGVRLFDEPGWAFLRALDPAAYAASVAIWALAAWRPRGSPVPIPLLSTPAAS